MSFLNKIGNTISAAGKDGMTKAKELKDTTKLNMDIKERESAIQRLYAELGKAYYENHKNDAELSYGQIKSINEAFNEIEKLKSAIDSIKGVKKCPACGNTVPASAKFCDKCGNRFKDLGYEDYTDSARDYDFVSQEPSDKSKDE